MAKHVPKISKKLRVIPYSTWQKELDKYEKKELHTDSLTAEQIKFLKYCYNEDGKVRIPYREIAIVWNKQGWREVTPLQLRNLSTRLKEKGLI